MARRAHRRRELPVEGALQRLEVDTPILNAKLLFHVVANRAVGELDNLELVAEQVGVDVDRLRNEKATQCGHTTLLRSTHVAHNAVTFTLSWVCHTIRVVFSGRLHYDGRTILHGYTVEVRPQLRKARFQAHGIKPNFKIGDLEDMESCRHG